MKLLGTCSKGARVHSVDGDKMYTVAHDLTSIDHFGTKHEMKRGYCEQVCDKARQDTCYILNFM